MNEQDIKELKMLIGQKVLIKILDCDGYYYNDTNSTYTFTADDVEDYSDGTYYLYGVYTTGLAQHTHFILELHEI